MTVAPPAGAADVSVTVPVTFPPPRIDPAERPSEDREATGKRLSTPSAVIPFARADTTAPDSIVTGEVFTVNVPVVCPEGTVSVDEESVAIESDALRATVTPPAGAGPFSVTVALLEPPLTRLAGESATVMGAVAPVTVTVAVLLTVDGYFAVIVAVRFVLPATAVTVKAALFCPEDTVTLAGTVAVPVALLVSVTETFDETVPFSITVPVAVPVTRLTGLNVTDWISTADVTERLAVFEIPPKDAVIVAVLFDVTETVETENVAVRLPVGTVTLAGTVADASLEDSVTVCGFVAGAFRKTVPPVPPPPFTLEASRTTFSMATPGLTVTLAVFETPANAAVIVTFLLP